LNEKQPIHLLLRFSDNIYKGGTIAAHQEVIDQYGAVWFGKMGSTVSQVHIDKLNQQVEENIPTYVYLVKGNRRKSTYYISTLLLASKTLPDDEARLVPRYYADLNISKYVKFWVKLGDFGILEAAELNKMKVASSVLPIGETLYKSSSGHFIICASM